MYNIFILMLILFLKSIVSEHLVPQRQCEVGTMQRTKNCFVECIVEVGEDCC